MREIARRTGLSRNIIRNYLRTGAVEPKFTASERPSKLASLAVKHRFHNIPQYQIKIDPVIS
jgi:hypothetical protein